MIIMSEYNDRHRKFAVECFNGTWDLLEKPDRSVEDDSKMIHMAHASRFHWGEIGEPINLARGDWQIARVYAVLNQAENSLKYARSSLHVCLENGIQDFDLAFGYEAIARAYAILGDKEMQEKYINLAKEAGNKISKPDDKNYFFRQLDTIVK
jgi:hypothetical protein